MGNIRKQYIDILRGISILSIMLLHFEEGLFPSWLSGWIGGFMVNAFYFISGWLQWEHSPDSMGVCLRKRWKSLVVPYLWFSLFIICFEFILYLFGCMDLKNILWDIFKTCTLRGIGTLWFLPALLGSELVFIYFRQRNALGKSFMAVAALCLMQLWDIWNLEYSHLNEFFRIVDAPIRTLANVMNAWYVMAAGYYICQFYQNFIIRQSVFTKFILSLFLLIGYTVCVIFPYYPLGYIILSILGPLGLLIGCMLIEKWSVNRFFSFWGKNSLIMMVTHYSFLLQICIIVNKHWTGEPALYGNSALIYFAAALILEYPLVFLINKKMPFLVGK